MVSSPKYEQLMRFATAAEDGLTQLEKHDPLHRQTIEGLTDMIERVKHFREHQGFEGLTGDAIKKWIEASLSRYDAEFTGYVSGFSHYLEARRMLKHAAEDARLLPTALLDSKTAAMRDLAQVVIPVTKYMGLWGFPFNSLATTGEAYVNAVEAQANAAREEQSEKILARITKASSSLASSLHECTEAMRKIPDSKDGMKFPVPPPSPTPVVKVIERGNVPVSDHDPSVYGGDRDTDFGRSGQRDPKSGVYPDGYDEGGRISDRIMSSKRIPNTFVPEGELGSRLNPVTDPNDLMNIDLLHSRVNGDRHANGVIGGHTPASPIDRDHPLWRLNGGPAGGSGLGAGTLAAGALGVGALGAGALGMRGSLSLNSATAGAAGAGVGGTGVAGAAGASGASGRPGMGGFMGAGAGAGGKGGKEDRKARRHRYTPFRFEDDEDELPEGYVNPLSQTYGSDKDLSPAPRKDDGWDPRQW
jgi:hypothetical protein